MDERIRASRSSPAIIVAIAALVAGLAGTALAERAATSAKPVTKKKVKKVARKQVNKLAPGLSVKHAGSAGSAQNADALGGKAPSAYTSIVRSQNLPQELTISNTNPNTLNTVNINAPTAGTLTISGKTFVNNDNANAGLWTLNVRIDGTLVTADFAAAQSGIAGNGTGGNQDKQMLSYTIARPVAAGAHNVTQEIDVDIQPYRVGGKELVVEFTPGGA